MEKISSPSKKYKLLMLTIALFLVYIPVSSPSAFGATINLKATWTPNTETDMAGYNLYRTGGTWMKINSTLIPHPPTLPFPFSISVPDGSKGTAVFVLRAVNKAGKESANSNPASYYYDTGTRSEVISTPTTPSGPSSGFKGTSYSFSTGGSSSNLSHPVSYRFDWGDGTVSAFGSSSQSHTWTAPGTYSVRAQAACKYDPVISAWSSSHAVSIQTVTTSPGVLSVSYGAAAGTVDLTAGGSLDWAHWGLSTVGSFDHKSGVYPQISNYTVIGVNSVRRFGNNPVGFSWRDGTPTASVTNTLTGVSTNGIGRGFQISLPAYTTDRTLRLYVGVWKARGRFEARLSDGSTSYVDTSFYNSIGTSVRVYTIRYRAGTSGQRLTVKWTVLENYDANGYGNVTLQAATLVGGGSISQALAVNAGAGKTVTSEAVSTPKTPSGPSSGLTGTSYTSSKGKPFIQLTSPNGGENLVVGNPYTITWNSAHLNPEGTLYLFYSNDRAWHLITTLSPNHSSFSWTIPRIPGNATTPKPSGFVVPGSLWIGNWVNGKWESYDNNDYKFKILYDGWLGKIYGEDQGGATIMLDNGTFDGYGISLKLGMFRIEGAYSVDLQGGVNGAHMIYGFDNPGYVLYTGKVTGTIDTNSKKLTLGFTASDGTPIFNLSGVRLPSEPVIPRRWAADLSGSASGSLTSLQISPYQLGNDLYSQMFEFLGAGSLTGGGPINIRGYFYLTSTIVSSLNKTNLYGIYRITETGEIGNLTGSLNPSKGTIIFKMTGLEENTYSLIGNKTQ